ncbi:MAG: helix-turn-helix domain containing protein [Phaeodactylibacter sp.]|nr:helix-turn-helix domain containing protein [Phaeodactylibacter sp.]
MRKAHVQLAIRDKTELKALISKGSLGTRAMKRAIALLELGQGKAYKEVAAKLGISSVTISAWADKYEEVGLALLKDKPRPGRPPIITGGQREKIVALAGSDPPEGHEKWSLRLLAEKAISLGYVDSISHQYINQILKESEIQLY